MDFNSLGLNSPIYIVRKKPFSFETGTLKSKTPSIQTPNPYMPQMAKTIDVVVTVNGIDEPLTGIPIDKDIVEAKNSYYSISPEGAQQAVSTLIQMAKAGIDEQPYYNSVISEGEKVMEKLNPQYAENKKQARIVKELQDRADAQDKKLDNILNILQEFTGGAKK